MPVGPKNHFLLQTTAFSLSCWQSCHHPLGKAPAARDRLHKQQVTGSCLVESSQFAVSWKGRGQSGVATKPFRCISPPVSVSCCPWSSWRRQQEALEILPVRWVWPLCRGDLFYRQVYLYCFCGPEWRKKAFSSGSFSPMKGNWGCHAESCRNVTDRHVWCNSVLSLCCDHGGSVDVHMGDVRLFTLL